MRGWGLERDIAHGSEQSTHCRSRTDVAVIGGLPTLEPADKASEATNIVLDLGEQVRKIAHKNSHVSGTGYSMLAPA